MNIKINKIIKVNKIDFTIKLNDRNEIDSFLMILALANKMIFHDMLSDEELPKGCKKLLVDMMNMIEKEEKIKLMI